LMRSKGEAPYALRMFINEVGIPDLLISDNAFEERSIEWNRILREFNLRERKTEAYKSWQNYAENAVKLVKLKVIKIVEQKGVPIPLWDHALEYAVSLNNRIYHPCPRLGGRTPHEITMGSTPDISAFITYGFYDHVWYIVMPVPKFPEPRRKIGRFLGPSKTSISDLVFKILSKSGLIDCCYECS